MTFLTLLIAAAAFALFALSTDEVHGRQLRRRPSASEARRLRTGAWIALALAFSCAIAASGWIFGPILWAGAAMAAAGLVFLTVNFLGSRPGTSVRRER